MELRNDKCYLPFVQLYQTTRVALQRIIQVTRKRLLHYFNTSGAKKGKNKVLEQSGEVSITFGSSVESGILVTEEPTEQKLKSSHYR